ncbi:tryptophan--tRNA ligase [Entomophthora muscae]|uniref:Tryptophan--tRNA ligase n=1 Tax=Entomophthora muscae TaxID=34485 RepID=A0ACC2TPU7_9FUNG|nr:tryptophan--tRNA ligase [Entomophthora muscae]
MSQTTEGDKSIDNIGADLANASLQDTAKTDQKVTPWEVEGEIGEDGEKKGIDYDKLINQFGTKKD